MRPETPFPLRFVFSAVLLATGPSAVAGTAPTDRLAPRFRPSVAAMGPLTTTKTGGGLELETRVEEEVLEVVTETDRILDTATRTTAEVVDGVMVFTLDVQDTCRSRQVQSVQVSAITEGVGGASARKTMAWLGAGGLALAGLGLVAPLETSGDISGAGAKVLYSGAFGALGVLALVRVKRMQPNTTIVRTVARPSAWSDTSCPSETLAGRTLAIVAAIGATSVSLDAGETDAAGVLRIPLAEIEAAVDAALRVAPPTAKTALRVQVDDNLPLSQAMPAALLEPTASARQRHADTQAKRLLREARVAGDRGDLETSAIRLGEARKWVSSDASRDAMAAADARFERQMLQDARSEWRRIERANLPICRRVQRTVSDFESTVNRLARRDPSAAEAYIEKNRARVEAQLGEMSEAVEAMSEVFNDMDGFGVSDEERVAVVRRTGAACGR
jgi:hypothetical protein